MTSAQALQPPGAGLPFFEIAWLKPAFKAKCFFMCFPAPRPAGLQWVTAELPSHLPHRIGGNAMAQFKAFALVFGAALLWLGSAAVATPIASLPSAGISATAVHTEGMVRREARRGERRLHRYERRSERYEHRYQRRAIRHGYY